MNSKPSPSTRQAHTVLQAVSEPELPRVLCELLEAAARSELGPAGSDAGAHAACIHVLAALCAPLTPDMASHVPGACAISIQRVGHD